MKKAFFGTLLLMCIATLVFAQGGSRVMIAGYNYSIYYVAEDSSGLILWTFDGLNGDIDTSETINISTYHDVGTIFNFNWGGETEAAHADSLAVSIYGIVSWNDTTWILVDSVAAGPLTVAETAICSKLGAADTCYYKDWSLPPAPYFKIILKTYQDITDVLDGWDMTIEIMKQP